MTTNNNQQTNKWKEVMDKLKAPFKSSEIEWRVQSASNNNNGGYRVLVLPYINARAIMERLDSVLGPDWKDDYESIEFNGKPAYRCRLSIKVDGEWITRTDAAEVSEYEAVKGGHSNAFKRVAVKWGIGRYLYDVPNKWVDVKQNGDCRVSGQFKVKGQQTYINGYFDRPDISGKNNKQPGNNNQQPSNNNGPSNQKQQTNNRQPNQQQSQTSTKPTNGPNKTNEALNYVLECEKAIGFDLKYRKAVFAKANDGNFVELDKASEQQLKNYYQVMFPVKAIILNGEHYGHDLEMTLAYAQTCFQERISSVENLFFKTDKKKAEQVNEVLKENAPSKALATA